MTETHLRELESTYSDPARVSELSSDVVSDDVIDLIWEVRRLRERSADLESQVLLLTPRG